VSRNAISSGSDVTDGVGTMTGDEDEVSDSFCCLGACKECVFLVFWSFMDHNLGGLLASKVPVGCCYGSTTQRGTFRIMYGRRLDRTRLKKRRRRSYAPFYP